MDIVLSGSTFVFNLDACLQVYALRSVQESTCARFIKTYVCSDYSWLPSHGGLGNVGFAGGAK